MAAVRTRDLVLAAQHRIPDRVQLHLVTVSLEVAAQWQRNRNKGLSCEDNR